MRTHSLFSLKHILIPVMAFVLLAGLWSIPAFTQNSTVSADAASAAPVKNPYAGDTAAAAAGAKLFDEKCAECHGDGTGLSGPDLSDDKWYYGGEDGEVFASIKNGRPGGMPSWSSELSDEHIWKLLTFIRSLRK